jgi:yecA family protein
MTRPALPYDELDEILRGDGHAGYVGLSAIDGLIAAVVAGPQIIAPTTWLPQIFGNKMPRPAAGSIEERVVNTVLNRHDEVEHLLSDAPGDYGPIFMNDNGRVHVDDWGIGFTLGVGMAAPDAWLPILLAQPRPVIAPIMVINPNLSQMLVRVGVEERRKLRAQAHRHIGPAVLQLYTITRATRARTGNPA